MINKRILFLSFSFIIICASVSISIEEMLVYSRPLSGVYLANGDSEERIIYRQGAHIAPKFSPDGKQILFHSRQGGKIGIWVADLHGEARERICDGEQANWSPDGEKIVLSRDNRIIERDIASGREQQIAGGHFPGYLPDGSVMFVLNGRDIFTVNPIDLFPPQQLISGQIKSAPRCSPDGKYIAYQNGAHIYLMDMASNETRQLTKMGGVQSWPVWSRNSGSILYCQSPNASDGPWDIYIIQIESPKNAGLIVRDVEVGFDWCGSEPPISDTVEIGGNNAGLENIEIIAINGEINSIRGDKSYIEIKPSSDTDKVYIKHSMKLALLPDRLADDLLFAPDESRTLLPYVPFLLGLSEGEMLLIAAPSKKQEVWLIKHENGSSFNGIEISMGGESVYISILSGDNLWNRTKIMPDSDASGWRLSWSRPFFAQWRMTVAGQENQYSRMWNEDELSKKSKPFLPVSRDFKGRPEQAVIYLYDRSWNTPLDITTPMDILRDVVGIDRLGEMLDIKGIRAYRADENSIPMHTLLTSQGDRLWPEESSGWPADLDFSPYHQLLVRIRMVERNGVSDTANHLCRDILNMLKELDGRIGEYREFLRSNEFIAEIEESEKDENIKIEEISDAVDAVNDCLGSDEYLWDRDEFYKFWDLSKSALSERQQILKNHRDIIKQIRNNAGIAVTNDPNAKAASENIRTLTQQILGNRCYLEGDWRGEKPL